SLSRIPTRAMSHYSHWPLNRRNSRARTRLVRNPQVAKEQPRSELTRKLRMKQSARPVNPVPHPNHMYLCANPESILVAVLPSIKAPHLAAHLVRGRKPTRCAKRWLRPASTGLSTARQIVVAVPDHATDFSEVGGWCGPRARCDLPRCIKASAKALGRNSWPKTKTNTLARNGLQRGRRRPTHPADAH